MPSSAAPTVFVLFGATGDLAHRLVLPAFFTLADRDLLPDRWWLVGNGRGDHPHEHFRKAVRDALEADDSAPNPDDLDWDDVASRVLFAGGGFSADDPGALPDVLAEIRKEAGDSADEVQLVFYLALPPSVFLPVTKALAAHGLTEGARVVYEKPYGTSPSGFEELDAAVHEVLDEDQVFRIDHFLGKEATQDLHVLRFANQLFTGVWNREHVAQVQIDVPETLDIDDRAQFYDATGATLDMLVTHLFQVAAEVAMEPPAGSGALALQEAREAVIAAFRPLAKDDVVLGQYQGYRDVEGVADDSTTDTFVAARLWVDTDRWHGVPFLLRTGKRLAASAQQVTLVFREPDGPVGDVPVRGSFLRVSLAGDGQIDIGMVLKEPGPEGALVTGTAALPLERVPRAEPLPAYATLLLDVMAGDKALFTSREGLQHAWKAATSLLADRPAVQPYEQGSWGPDAAHDLPAGGWMPLLSSSGSS
ncbi:glucose-6-phosphate dehydrogenase [Spongisporangium articulatum]|uniref:Glucose-6-phosphate 1-dehydrogenase n=1 Tax=Spongisporangium articulatum TaxID=3362603 RepID=A0ABW8AM83_9ACTN